MAKLFLNQTQYPEYTGVVQPNPEQWSDLIQAKLYPYYASEGLIEAVNLAIRLNRPLLLEGEPGCGKSQLARSIFYEFSQKYSTIQWRYRQWNILSTTKAQEGFYTYKETQQPNVNLEKNQTDPTQPENSINLGPLGQAFEQHNCRTVVLIDEIDQADPILHNDLLFALEEKRYQIQEVFPPRLLIANSETPPIILITSNQEKDFSQPFLRRCLYHYIEFPEPDQLGTIINARFNHPPKQLVYLAIERFLELREEMEEERGENGKKVSVSELIDWFTLLNSYPTREALKKLRQPELPFPSVLLKTYLDYSDYVLEEDQ